MHAFLAVAPFGFVGELHRLPLEVEAYLALLVASLGSVLASRLFSHVPIERLPAWTSGATVLAGFVLLGIMPRGALSVPLLLGPMLVFTVGVGLVSTMAFKAVGMNPHVIGSAAGLCGFSQMAIGALCTELAGLGADPALTAASVLAAAGVIGKAAFWMASRAEKAKLREPP